MLSFCRTDSLARRLVALSLLASLGGCYSYNPAPAGTLRRAAPVRVHLSTPMSFDLGEVTVQQVVRAEGEVVEWSDSALAFSATGLVSGAGQRFLGRHMTLYVPRANLAGVEVKEIAPLRSALVAGAGVAFALLTALWVSGGIGGSDDPGGGGPPAK